ncbi:rhodanese-like domain-containing protein [Roseateles sp. P5_E7]
MRQATMRVPLNALCPCALSALFAVASLAGTAASAQNSFGGATPPPPAGRATPAPPPQPSPNSVDPRRAAPAAESQAGLPRTDPQRLAQLEGKERADQGVPASTELHSGAMHGATPASIPGGQVVTTRQLVATLGARREGGANALPPLLLFDVLGGAERLPGALNAVPAHQAGSFDDNVQREFGAFLKQVTQGRQDLPLVFYCASTMCWMSYNAALRAIRMGYQKVGWYRGGVEAWKEAGLPIERAGAPGQRPGN